jgi:hypothetical protein
MNSHSQALPLVCHMDVFSPAERENHIQTATQLFQTVQRIQDEERGYEFIFPGESATLIQLAEFISKERLCCQFLEFTLKIVPNYETTSLLLTGPEGTREFLRAEFSEAFV